MAQMGFFDLSDRYPSLDAKKDPLTEIDEIAPWEGLRPGLEQVWRKPDSERKSNAGRKPMGAVLMFKTLALAHFATCRTIRSNIRFGAGSGGWADAACRSEEIESKLKARGFTSRVHRKGKRGKPLTEPARKSNRTKSSVRVRAEHVFGAQANDMGGALVRIIGLARAKAGIEMKNLAYNIRRLGQLRRVNPCPA